MFGSLTVSYKAYIQFEYMASLHLSANYYFDYLDCNFIILFEPCTFFISSSRKLFSVEKALTDPLHSTLLTQL